MRSPHGGEEEVEDRRCRNLPAVGLVVPKAQSHKGFCAGCHGGVGTAKG